MWFLLFSPHFSTRDLAAIVIVVYLVLAFSVNAKPEQQ